MGAGNFAFVNIESALSHLVVAETENKGARRDLPF